MVPFSSCVEPLPVAQNGTPEVAESPQVPLVRTSLDDPDIDIFEDEF